ncbi:MAG: PH domain-containing protein [Fodinibius sp.]|nr:PH domain-containing protein [Fodinibius sp.]
MRQHFRAPSDNLVKGITAGVFLLFGSLSYFSPSIITIAISVAIIGASALFMVRSYEINDNQLIIHRPFWETTYDLQKLSNVEVNRRAMRKSWRMPGIGGGHLWLYQVSFHNSELGNYRAYATNRNNCVVLTFQNQKTVVVTPGSPEEFADAIRDTARL